MPAGSCRFAPVTAALCAIAVLMLGGWAGSLAAQRQGGTERSPFGGWLRQPVVGPFEYLDATMDGAAVDDAEFPIDGVLHWLRREQKKACLSLRTVQWRGGTGTVSDRLFTRKWYVIECSGNCRGISYQAQGVRSYTRAFHYGTSKAYPVVHMIGDISYQDFTWQFTRRAAGAPPRIRVFAFGSEWDRGPGCDAYQRGGPPAAVPSATPEPPQVSFTGDVLPPGTVITVRTLQSIRSATARIGATFAAELAEPLLVNGRVVADPGSRAFLKYLHDRTPRPGRGRTVTYVVLDAVDVQGRRVTMRGADSPSGEGVTRGTDVNIPQGARLRFVAR
jgi:hypothetical protein